MQKYIIIDHFKPILFDISLQHSQVAGYLNVTSAGFIEEDRCFGRSDSLNIDSNPNDYRIIRRFFLNLSSKGDKD